MKTYSLDFRQKIMDVYHNEPLSQRAIANRFCVALSLGASHLCNEYKYVSVYLTLERGKLVEN